jgi:hypothetical protein
MTQLLAQNNIIPFTSIKSEYCPVTHHSIDTLQRLIAITNQTNLVAIDKSLAAIRAHRSWVATAIRVGRIGERMVRAAYEVGLTLPLEMRVTKNEKSR